MQAPRHRSLISVRCGTWGGFVFINMDPTAEPLLDYLSPVPRTFAPFQFENMRVTWWKSLRVPCNWKTALDGFLESYHAIGTHPQLGGQVRRPLSGCDGALQTPVLPARQACTSLACMFAATSANAPALRN